MSNPYGPPLETWDDLAGGLVGCCWEIEPGGPSLIGESIDFACTTTGIGFTDSAGTRFAQRTATSNVGVLPEFTTGSDSRTEVETYDPPYQLSGTCPPGPEDPPAPSNYSITKSGSSSIVYSISSPDDPATLSVNEQSFNESTSTTTLVDGEWSRVITTVTSSGGNPAVTTTGIPSYHGLVNTTYTYALPIGTAVETGLRAAVAAADFEDCRERVDGYDASYFFKDVITAAGVPFVWRAFARKIRYKWQIPSEHTGSYFKITWDVAFYPSDGPATLVERDITVVWEGPGTGDQDDPSWLTSTWYDMGIPTEEGQHSVVNIRYLNMSASPYGVLPSLIGSVVVDEPPPE